MSDGTDLESEAQETPSLSQSGSSSSSSSTSSNEESVPDVSGSSTISNDSATGDASSGQIDQQQGGSTPEPSASAAAAAGTSGSSNSASSSSSCITSGGTSSSAAGGSAAANGSNSNQEQSVRRRVKLYLLNAERQWDDKGTGYVSSPYVESLGGTSLVVRAEVDASLLLESKVLPETAYQRQQGTLIVWSEGDNYDLALSFQERAGCDEIWKTICQIQGRDPSVDITQEAVESEDETHDSQVALHSSSRAILPSCEISHLSEISRILQECLPFPMRRDSVASAIEAEDYITKLLDLFTVAEDLDDTESLHLLYNIFKSIFLLNKNALLDMMFTEENMMQVVGVLEYEPNKPRIRHREYLNAKAKFHQVIPFSDPELTAKIHQTYRVQYIQEVVLPTPSIFEENMLSCLSSFVFFNKADIVSMLQEDRQFLDQLFQQLKQETSLEQKRDLVLFLKEFCNFSQTLQPQCREPFFKALFALGILQVLEVTLQSNDTVIKSASIDILSYLVDFSTAMVREYCLEQYQNLSDRHLMGIILEQILADPEPDVGVSVQLSGILRMLLDPETFMPNENKNSFLTGFYKYSMHVLTDIIVEHQKTPPTPPKASLLAHIIEFLSFCVEHHSYHIKNYILHKDLLKKVLEFMKYRNPHLALCALRFVRRIIGLKDDFYNRHITVNCLLRPVVDALKRNSGRYNLLDSAIIELFEFIRSEDIPLLGIHAVEHYGAELEEISYVQTFRALRAKFEEPLERQRLKMPSVNEVGVIGGSGGDLRFKRDPRQLDEDEEKWFDADDDALPATTAGHSIVDDDLDSKSDNAGVLSTLNGEGSSSILRSHSNELRMQESVNAGLSAVKLVDYEPDEDSDEDNHSGPMNISKLHSSSSSSSSSGDGSNSSSSSSSCSSSIRVQSLKSNDGGDNDDLDDDDDNDENDADSADNAFSTKRRKHHHQDHPLASSPFHSTVLRGADESVRQGEDVDDDEEEENNNNNDTNNDDEEDDQHHDRQRSTDVESKKQSDEDDDDDDEPDDDEQTRRTHGQLRHHRHHHQEEEEEEEENEQEPRHHQQQQQATSGRRQSISGGRGSDDEDEDDDDDVVDDSTPHNQTPINDTANNSSINPSAISTIADGSSTGTPAAIGERRRRSRQAMTISSESSSVDDDGNVEEEADDDQQPQRKRQRVQPHIKHSSDQDEEMDDNDKNEEYAMNEPDLDEDGNDDRDDTDTSTRS